MLYLNLQVELFKSQPELLVGVMFHRILTILEIKKQFKKVLIFLKTHIVGYGGDRMKKIIFFIGIMVVLLICGMFIKWAFIELFYAKPTVMQTYVSPNGRYTAYVYESNGGATTGWTYHISILPTEKKLSKGNGNIYISDIPPVSLEWIDNSTLYIDDYVSKRTTKRKEKIYGIDVRFKSLKKR